MRNQRGDVSIADLQEQVVRYETFLLNIGEGLNILDELSSSLARRRESDELAEWPFEQCDDRIALIGGVSL